MSFDKIKLYGNNISNISGLERVTIKQLAIQYNENLDFTQLNKNDVYSYCIIECPMDKRASLTTILGDKVEAFYTEQEYLQTQNNQ